MSQTFIISYLTYRSSNFKTSVKKNEDFQDLKTSVDSADSLYTTNPRNPLNVVLLPDKRLDYFLTVLKLVPNVQNSKKLNKASFFLEK